MGFQIVDDWQQGFAQDCSRDRADMAVDDGAIRRDDIGFGRAVNAPFDTCATVDVGPDARVGIAQLVEPSARLFGRIFAVDPIERDLATRRQIHEQRVLGTAGQGTHHGGEDVYQRDMTNQLLRRKTFLAAGNRGKCELGNK